MLKCMLLTLLEGGDIEVICKVIYKGKCYVCLNFILQTHLPIHPSIHKFFELLLHKSPEIHGDIRKQNIKLVFKEFTE